ncbi:hypothetical protein [Nonomuraea sp. PA05]|nr:hypothetical protein [Nonomuraea sp. PA05]
MTALFDLGEPCPKCGAPAGVQCQPDCVLMQNPSTWCEGMDISDADPGL